MTVVQLVDIRERVKRNSHVALLLAELKFLGQRHIMARKNLIKKSQTF